MKISQKIVANPKKHMFDFFIMKYIYINNINFLQNLKIEEYIRIKLKCIMLIIMV